MIVEYGRVMIVKKQIQTMEAYETTAREARLKVLDLIYKAQTSHIGSNFSCIDILTVLFDKIDLDKDRFVLSAGWKAAALYYFLWKKGRITEEQLNSYCQEGSEFIGLTEPFHKDIPIAGGSMGLGLPMAVGLALAKKLKGEEGNVYVLMSDGELNCGTTWESLLIARQEWLDNLIVLVDRNGFQAMGTTQSILDIPEGMIAEEFLNGHNFDAVSFLFKTKSASVPRVCIFETTKGKGVSFMENNNLWHYKAPNEDEYNRAKAELCQI